MKHLPLFILPVLLSLTGGCNLIGAVAFKAASDPQIKPLFLLGKEPVIVLAENYRDAGSSEIDSQQLAQYVTHELREHNLGNPMDATAAIDLRSKDANKFRAMTITQIGKAVGAQRVIYLNIADSQLDSAVASEMMKGSIHVNVRIVDVESGETLWPLDAADGFPVSASTPVTQLKERVTADTVRQSRNQRAAILIGRLFRAYRQTDEEVGAG